MPRHTTLGGALFVWLVAASASASAIEFSFDREPPQLQISAGAKTHAGFRVSPGSQLALTAKGGGVFKLLYFQEFVPGKPPASDVRLMITIDGAGKMFPLEPKAQPGIRFATAQKTAPSGPNPINLQLSPGEHKIVLKLGSGLDLGGLVAFPEATYRSSGGADLDLGDDDLGLAAPPPKKAASLDLDDGLDLPPLDLPPPPPPKAGKPAAAASADLDLDLDVAPLPKGKDVKKPAPGADFDLDLDLDAPPAKPAPKDAGKPAVAAKPPPAPPKPAAKPAVKPPPAPKPAAVALVAPAAPKAEDNEDFLDAPPPQLGAFEAGPRGGYALARGHLKGQGVFLFEVAYRLPTLPRVRATFATGYTMLTGTWKGIEPGRGLGWFQQNTEVVPLELGATFEPVSWGILTPYVGAGLSFAVASTSMQRFSLAEQKSRGTALGFSGDAGLRLQVGRGVLLGELRHTERAVPLTAVARVGQQTLSATTLSAGYMHSF